MSYLLVTILFLLTPRAGAEEGAKLASVLGKWGIAFQGLEEFTLKGNVREGKGGKLSELKAMNGEKVLRISKVSGIEKKAAERYIEGKKDEILSQYGKHFDGYFPPQAKGHVCPSEMQPVVKKTKNGDTEVHSLTAMASDRQVTGVCIMELAKYRFVMALAYCAKTREIFDVRYYSPVKSFAIKEQTAILSLTCEKAAIP